MENTDISCYICETTMDFIENKDVKMIGLSKVFKCPKCGEIVYRPIREKNNGN